MDKIYDVVIIGGGPSGYSAGLYAARAGLSTLLIEKMSPGGQMALTGDIDNYPGFDEGIDGFTLGMKMQNGAEKFGAETVYAQVTSLDFDGKIKKIITDSGEYFAKTVVISTGANPRSLGISGEADFVGRGVHYCAHCDGRFYKGKTVAVVGGGNSAVQDAIYLANLCEKVYLIHRRDSLRATKIYRQQVEKSENIEILWNKTVSEFVVDTNVTGLVLSDTADGSDKKINCDGVFVSIGREPATDFLRGVVDLDDQGYVIADETTKTNVAGVFAAGDVRTKALRQVVTAAADGATSIHFVEEYLAYFE